MNVVADGATMARSEASGLLMSVIRTLHETDTGQEREEEKRKLEAEFKQCDTTLDKMVASHQGELSSVMATYSTVSCCSIAIIVIPWISYDPQKCSYCNNVTVLDGKTGV